jgi:hypothetical protein
VPQASRSVRVSRGRVGAVSLLHFAAAQHSRLARSPARRAGFVRPLRRTVGARPVQVTRAGPARPALVVRVQSAGQNAGQNAWTDPPRRLSLGVPPQTGAEQSALGLKETDGRGAEEKEGEP